MAVMYIPYSLIQVDIDIKKLIDHLKTLGFKYVFDTEIDGQKYAIINYPNEKDFMIQYKGKEVKDIIEGTRSKTFHILEVDGQEMYEVSWDNHDTCGNTTAEVSTFDNYIDAFHQYEHIQKLKSTNPYISNPKLKITLLPLPNWEGDDS